MDKLDRIDLVPAVAPPKVFVLEFTGDVYATEVAKLREQVTGLLLSDSCIGERGDRVLLKLNSGGGTVTGYGLAAAQLNRLKEKGIQITVCVDEVAASGGYLMAAVADRLVASPFAVIGSVGVVTTIPNFSQRLLREGIEVEDVTAGEFKRTMTPYKKTSEADRKKVKSDVELVLTIFKDYLKKQRPSLNINDIATGEVWHGPQALEKGLIDGLATSDEEILRLYQEEGAEVFLVSMATPQPFEFDFFDMEGSNGFWTYLGGIMRNWVKSIVIEVFTGSSNPVPSVDFPGMVGGGPGYDVKRILAVDQSGIGLDKNPRSPRI